MKWQIWHGISCPLAIWTMRTYNCCADHWITTCNKMRRHWWMRHIFSPKSFHFQKSRDQPRGFHTFYASREILPKSCMCFWRHVIGRAWLHHKLAKTLRGSRYSSRYHQKYLWQSGRHGGRLASKNAQTACRNAQRFYAQMQKMWAAVKKTCMIENWSGNKRKCTQMQVRGWNLDT